MYIYIYVYIYIYIYAYSFFYLDECGHGLTGRFPRSWNDGVIFVRGIIGIIPKLRYDNTHVSVIEFYFLLYPYANHGAGI